MSHNACLQQATYKINTITMILDKIDQLIIEIGNLSAKNAEEIESLRLKYLGKKGE